MHAPCLTSTCPVHPVSGRLEYNMGYPVCLCLLNIAVPDISSVFTGKTEFPCGNISIHSPCLIYLFLFWDGVVVYGILNGLRPTQSSENNVTALADPRSVWCVKSIYLNLFASIGIWLFASCFHLMSFVLNTDKQNCFCVCVCLFSSLLHWLLLVRDHIILSDLWDVKGTDFCIAVKN